MGPQVLVHIYIVCSYHLLLLEFGESVESWQSRVDKIQHLKDRGHTVLRFNGRQGHDSLKLEAPADSTCTNLKNVARGWPAIVWVASTVSIWVQSEQLTKSIRSINKVKISSAHQIAEEILDYLPTSWTRVAGEARKYSNSIGDVRMHANRLVQQSDSVVGGADALDGAGKPREQAKENEIKVCRDIMLHIPREQAKENEIEVWGLRLTPLLPIYN
jgi:hypothetical protein